MKNLVKKKKKKKKEGNKNVNIIINNQFIHYFTQYNFFFFVSF